MYVCGSRPNANVLYIQIEIQIEIEMKMELSGMSPSGCKNSRCLDLQAAAEVSSAEVLHPRNTLSANQHKIRC